MQNVVLSMVSGIAPGARSRAGQRALVLEVLCLLLDIIAPKLRPVSVPRGCCSPACLLAPLCKPHPAGLARIPVPNPGWGWCRCWCRSWGRGVEVFNSLERS